MSNPPLISKPITDNLASTVSMARHYLNSLDRRSEKTILPTATAELIIDTLIKLYEAKELDKKPYLAQISNQKIGVGNGFTPKP